MAAMRSWALNCAFIATLLAATATAADLPTAPTSACARVTQAAEESSSTEPAGVGAGLVLDEHLLTDGSSDRDYNGGGEVTLSGLHGGPLGRVLDRALGLIDEALCPRSRFAGQPWRPTHAFAAGLLVFTPNDLTAPEVINSDRPYASLFFLSVGRRYTSPEADVAYDSSLTVGMLGLTAAKSVQRALHHLTGSQQPQGWSHQISAGGEPTARYSTARQAFFASYGTGSWHGDSKWTAAASVGTVTEASVALNARWGRVESPWWSFTPEENMYVQETQPVAPPLPAHAPAEVFAFAGTRLKLRGYDAFLQGQFRHSDLRYGEGSLNPLLAEVWGGIELRTASGWAVQYLARWESPELRSGIGSRSILWGSVEIAKSFR